ncbi:MAG: amino acid adenylation domain-containing protein, partial [Acidobacteria bacterium]|nr:amino acid adenylation domain-containing protein [Acidobacteriota bacterium]
MENTSLTRLLTGGDKLNVFIPKNYQLYNNYGPTENTVVTTVFPVNQYTANIPIGKPIDNTYVYILHPQSMTLQPVGAPGELCIAGIGLARGYIDDPELTRGSFGPQITLITQIDRIQKTKINKSFAGVQGELFQKLPLVYHSGDLARWLPVGSPVGGDSGGVIQFLGRIDRQVKVRGYRIELEEISSRLLKLGKIKEAIVLQHTGADNQSYLRAYIVPSNDEELIEDEIKEKLALQLPAYMVPDHIVVIDAIPLTANGKVDRKALANIASETGTRSYQAPRDSFERKLAELWAHVLHIPFEHIGIDGDFFQLGGHSLRAAALASHITGHFHMSIPLVEIFARPVLSDMAAYIKNLGMTSPVHKEFHDTIQPAEKKEYYPLSAAQERFYFLQQVEPESTGYNAPIILEVVGKLDREKLEHAFQELIDRHESFRTSFELIAETPAQKIQDRLKFKIEYTEMNSRRGAPEAVSGEHKVHPYHPSPPYANYEILCRGESCIRPNIKLGSSDLYKNFIRPFDLSQAPLLRIELLKVTEDKHILMLDMHHIISDGSTLNIIINELKSIYEGRTLPSLQVQYKDFAIWQTSQQHREEIRRQETYWLETFAGELPVLNLPLDFPRGPLQDKNGEVVIARAGRIVTQAAKALEKQTGATLFMILMAVFNTLLMRYTEAEDIIAGTLLAGRPHRDLEPIAGAFITGLAMRNFPAATKPFSFFLEEVKENSLTVFSNQEYPFEELYEKIAVNRALNRNPLFDVMLIVQNMERTEFTLEGLRFTPLAAGKENVNYDLQISAAEVQDDIHFKLLYAAKLFRPSFIERMGRHLTCLLEDAARHPDKTLAHLEMLTSAEKQQVLETFNDTEQPFPLLTVHQLFEQQAERTPGFIAVIAGHRFITYRQLDSEANVCAGRMKAMGIVPGGSIVGFMTGRSLEMMSGILGILKTGAAYLPLEPSLPVKRLQHILEQAEPLLLAIHRPLKKTAERILPPGKTIPFLYCEDMALEKSVPVSSGSACDLTATMYIFFTSGTTGSPRGIRTIHMNIAAYIHAFCHLFSLKAKDRTLQQSSIAFDAFAEETFAIFTVGGAVVMPRDEEIKDPEALRALVMTHGITILSCSPLMINEFNKRAPMPSLHTIASGTDILKKEYYTKIINHTHIYNLYGPTETTVCATSYACTGEEESTVPIGKPLTNYRVYILDPHDNPVPSGIPGEIYIGGPGVSQGYLNRPELTAEKFKRNVISHLSLVTGKFKRNTSLNLTNDQCPMSNDLFYRTGDTGRWLEDGNIEFFSRIDHQVKIRGYRIELGEIESRLLKHPQISSAVVINRKDKEGDNYLCAYIVPAPLPGEDRPLTVPVLRTYLLEYLPEYMVPSYYIVLDAIPMSANGKVDRRQLPELTTVTLSGQTYEPPANEQERILTNIWAELLNREPGQISVTDNFFDIGGHSLKGMNLIARMHQAFQVQVPLSAIFRHPTIREMAANINERHFSTYSEIPALPLKEYYPVSKTQQWMYIVSQMLRPGQYGYNTPFGIIIEGELETGRLQDVFMKLIARHEAFRTSFMILPAPAQTTNVKEEELLVQRIHAAEDVTFQLEHYRLDKEPEPGPETVEKVLGVFREFVRAFDLRRPPLLRAGLLEIGPRRYMIMIDMHHIITDGSSTVIFSHDFTAFYQGESLPPLRIQYKEYAVWKNNWLHSDMAKQQREYWQKIFSGILPVLELPHDFPRPPVQDFSGDTVSFLVSPDAYRALQEITQKTGTTIFMALLAIHSLLMMKYSDSEDIIIGTVMAGRPHADLAEVIGAFITILALRIKPRKDKSFNNFLQEVKRHCLDAFENQDYPFDSLLEILDYKRNPSRSALFDTMI